MATKSFAIPFDDDSKQTGDITFTVLAETNADTVFKITHVSSEATIQLNLRTKKNGTLTNHIHAASFADGDATATLSHSAMGSILSDAKDGDWDYVEAKWTAGSFDQQGTSNNYEIQSGKTYDFNGWPPAQ
jgi:hypothetical protein